MRILVCGGRDYGHVKRTKPLPEQEPPKTQERLKEYRYILDTLSKLADEWPQLPPDQYGNTLPAVTIITGGATGADSAAEDWAAVNWTDLQVYRIKPSEWLKYGKAAGPHRNQRMIDEGEPDLVVAFPGGKGTADMVKRAKAAGIKVIEIPKA